MASAALPAAPESGTAPPDPASATDAETLVDRSAIARLLAAYERAYDSRSVSALAEVWPSLDTAGFTRAFGSVREQDLSFGECEYTVFGGRAVVRCPGQVRYVQRVGSAESRTRAAVWMITLARVGEEWKVENLAVK